MARAGAVVQTVPAARVVTVASAVIALLAFTVAVIKVHDRVEVVITALPGAVIWGGLMIWVLPRLGAQAPPPLRIAPHELPPKASLLKAMIPGMALYAIVNGALLFATLGAPLSSSVGTSLGIILGGPIVMGGFLHRIRRTERELGGTLWTTPNFAWTSRSRTRYLVEA